MTTKSNKIGFEGILLEDEPSASIGFENFEAEEKDHASPAYPLGINVA